MSFIQSADSLRPKAHLSHIPIPMLVGSACLALLAVIGIGVGFATFFGPDPALTVEAAAEDDNKSNTDEGGEDSSSDEVEQDSASGVVTVHVAGEVDSPGVYELPEGARVDDAVEAAGGMTKVAADDAVNLARLVVDGEQVHIPSEEDVAAGQVAAAEGSSVGVASNTGQSSSATSGLVNINTADAAELDALPGVGPATAEAIIAEREENGLFAAPEDIQRVSGIGEKKYQKMKDSICV